MFSTENAVYMQMSSLNIRIPVLAYSLYKPPGWYLLALTKGKIFSVMTLGGKSVRWRLLVLSNDDTRQNCSVLQVVLTLSSL
jgi:hypothetical protein